MYTHFFKRVIDILLSLILISITLIPMVLIALIVRIDSRGPAIFKQERLGRNGKVFRMYKFRSMCINAEHTGSGVYSGKNDNRVTRIGKILRATSLDELPQFFNILFGHMSFVGPRPPLTYHPWPLEQYTDEQRRMFKVRPGITGWAQVNGRKGVEWNKRIQLNVWYVDHLSLGLDIKIICSTIGKVLSNADNVNTDPTAQSQETEKESSVS